MQDKTYHDAERRETSMIVCPNCSHQNPDGAMQCEACYTPLPAATTCPNCGAMVQSDASFCGQCGFNLRAVAVSAVKAENSPMPNKSSEESAGVVAANLPDLIPPDPLIAPEPIIASSTPPSVASPSIEPAIAEPAIAPPAIAPPAEPVSSLIEPGKLVPPPMAETAETASTLASNRTQLQQQTAKLLHVQTNATVELPNTSVIHLGKPNDRIPPDIDVSGFPNSEIVSRIHADIRLEGDAYYIEDVGSSNGTYINNLPLVLGNRHRLRPGDRIGLGKGDKVTFLFQLS